MSSKVFLPVRFPLFFSMSPGEEIYFYFYFNSGYLYRVTVQTLRSVLSLCSCLVSGLTGGGQVKFYP